MENILVNEKEEELLSQIENSVNEVIPNDYIEVKLDSLGKLDAPAILHFRNYTMDEAVELAAIKEENNLKALIKCLNEMNYEKFDCALLHESELEEIMVQIYLNFWGKSLPEYSYYIDDTLKEDKLEDHKNISSTPIEISKLKTNVINEKFKEPIKIQIDKDTVYFKLPRIKDIFLAKEYVNKKYFEEERRLSDVENSLDKKDLVTFEENEQFEELQLNKSRDLLRIIEASLLVKYNNIELDNIDKKLSYFKKVGLDFWKSYNKVVSEQLSFGIDPNVTFFCLVNKKEITRRFRFQPMDFIPSLGLSENSRAVVSFGD